MHNISKIALRDDHVFIDAVGKNSQDTHIKVNLTTHIKCTISPYMNDIMVRLSDILHRSEHSILPAKNEVKCK